MKKITTLFKIETDRLNIGAHVGELIEAELLTKLAIEARKEELITVKRKREFSIDPIEADHTIITAEAMFMSKEQYEELIGVMCKIKFALSDGNLDLYHEAINLITK